MYSHYLHQFLILKYRDLIKLEYSLNIQKPLTSISLIASLFHVLHQTKYVHVHDNLTRHLSWSLFRLTFGVVVIHHWCWLQKHQIYITHVICMLYVGKLISEQFISLRYTLNNICCELFCVSIQDNLDITWNVLNTLQNINKVYCIYIY